MVELEPSGRLILIGEAEAALNSALGKKGECETFVMGEDDNKGGEPI
jgi:hypothetical protein